MNEVDARFWSDKLSVLIAGLNRLTAKEFLDDRNGAPSTVSRGLDELCGAFEIDIDDWKRFMRANPLPRRNWLPIDAAALETMGLHEIYYRLGENATDERWVDDALVEAFESGSLIKALEKIAANVRSFDLSKG